MTTHLILHPSDQYSHIVDSRPYILNRGAYHAPRTGIKTTPKAEILFISSFPPRECGIATYTQDLVNALEAQFNSTFDCVVCALESDNLHHTYEIEPKYILQTNDRNSFAKAAFHINRNQNIRLVVVQHEFGFYADEEDAFQTFLQDLVKPVILVFHTVLPIPDQARFKLVNAMASAADAVLVMTSDAAHILIEDYGIKSAQISTIAHGTHLLPSVDQNALKVRYGLQNRSVLATFGLLGPSKNIETTLRALPAIVAEVPDTLFLVLGKTHPSLLKHEGEAYRQQLEALVKSLKLEHHVRFINEYLPLATLLDYLQLVDVYLFTSKDPHQAVSGTFSYAVSSGCPIVSTPIPQAKDVLSQNNGLIFDFEDDQQLSIAVLKLLKNEKLRKELSTNGLQKMAATAWNNAAIAHAQLFKKLSPVPLELQYKIPELKLSHLENMTTDFGMLQFSKIARPDLESGYTADDNARALLAVCQHYSMFGDELDLKLASTYILYLEHCLQPNGRFLNYVGPDREFTLQNFIENLDDSNGRAIWALGYVSSLKGILPDFLTQEADTLLERVVPYLDKIHSTRAMAFMIKGLCYQAKPENKLVIQTLANRLVQMYKHESSSGWLWYEHYITYGNSVLPEALLSAYISLGREEYKEIAVESFDFLLSKLFVDNTFRAISNRGWMVRDRIHDAPKGGEQPIDVAYTLLALELFYVHTNKAQYKDKAEIVFSWFLGNNHLHEIVYNPVTGGCYDGLEEHNVNLNQGAESTISYLLARLAIARIHNREYSTQKVKLTLV